MALSFTAAANSSATVSIISRTCTLPIAVAAGDVVLIAASGGGNATPTSLTITNGSGDTYTDGGLGLISAPWALSIARLGAFLTPTVGTTTFTATISAANDFVEIYAWKVAGFTGTPTLDKSVAATGSSATADSGSSGTLTAAAEAAIGYVMVANNTNAAGSGWSTGGTNINDGISGVTGNCGEHRITAATTAINATASVVSGSWTAGLLTIYDAVAGGDVLAAQIWL